MKEKSETFCKDDESNLDDPVEVATAWFDNLCSSVAKAAEAALPIVRVNRMPTREVSEATSDLFKQREAIGRSLGYPSCSKSAKRRKRRR